MTLGTTVHWSGQQQQPKEQDIGLSNKVMSNGIYDSLPRPEQNFHLYFGLHQLFLVRRVATGKENDKSEVCRSQNKRELKELDLELFN